MPSLNNPFRRQDEEVQTALENWADAGLKFFTLRHRKRVKFDILVFGFDQVTDIRSVKGAGLKATLGKKATIFHPDNRDVLHAYLPDTPRNRQKLAQTFYTGDYTITGYFSQETGTLGENEAQKIIRDLSAKMGVTAATRRLETQASIRVRGKTNPSQVYKPAPAGEAVPGHRMTQEEKRKAATESVLAKWEPLVAQLKMRHGAAWQKCKEYREFIKPEIGKIIRDLDKGTETMPVPAQPVPAKRGRPANPEPAPEPEKEPEEDPDNPASERGVIG